MKKIAKRGYFKQFINYLMQLSQFIYPQYKDEPEFCLDYFLKDIIFEKYEKILSKTYSTEKLRNNSGNHLNFEPLRIIKNGGIDHQSNADILSIFVE